MAISGNIGSGKSYIASELSDRMNIPRTSFSDSLKTYAKNNKMLTNRESLQELGSKLINGLSSEEFLELMKNNSSYNWDDDIIIDGFRHPSIFLKFKNMYPDTILIYCECKDTNKRVNRISKRDDIKDRKIIYKIINHATEQEVDKLKNYSDIIIDTCDDNFDFDKDVLQKINAIQKAVSH